MRDVESMTESELYEERDDLEYAVGRMNSAKWTLEDYECETGFIEDAIDHVEKRLQEIEDRIGEINYRANMAVMADSYNW